MNRLVVWLSRSLFVLACAAAFAVAGAIAALTYFPFGKSAAMPGAPALSQPGVPDAMQRLREQHELIADHVARRQQEAEAKAQAEARARHAARADAEREAAENRAREQRAAMARLAEARPRPPEERRQTAKSEPAGEPLAIVPAGESLDPPVPKGPVELLLATSKQLTAKTVSALGAIGGWFVSAGERMLGARNAPETPPARLGDLGR